MSDLHLDPTTGLPFIADDGTGAARRMGRLLPSGPMALPPFRSYHAPIPRSEWVDIDMLGTFSPPVLNQGQYGSCTGHGSATAYTLVWLMQGEDLLRFSPCYIYGQINGGFDRGASIGDTIKALSAKGVCLEKTVPEGMIFARQFPAGADAEAANYKLIEAYQTNDPDDVATALQMGYAVCDSVMAGRRFNTFDKNGVVGIDAGPGNHAIAKAGMKKLPDGTWAFLNQNSWSETWGPLGGRFLTTEAHIQSQQYYEAVVLRAVSPGPNAPKIAA